MVESDEVSDSQTVEFKCHICGKDTDTAPDPPNKAICEDCCKDHDYEYCRHRRGKFCVHCDKQKEYEGEE